MTMHRMGAGRQRLAIGTISTPALPASTFAGPSGTDAPPAAVSVRAAAMSTYREVVAAA